MNHTETSKGTRRWPRHRIDVRLKVSYAKGSATVSVFGRANILSHGGMGAFIPCSIPLGTMITLEVSFPYSSTEVTLQAEVKTCAGFRYGLEFAGLQECVRDVIVKSCSSAALLQ